jgi:glutaredoxin
MTTSNTKVVTKTVASATAPSTNPINPVRLRNTDEEVLWSVLGLKDCPWTEKALALLKEHQEDTKHILITPEWQRRLIVEHRCRRSPAIFKGAQYFGSYSDVEKYYQASFFSERERL